jgi:putative ABC transport system permease protein
MSRFWLRAQVGGATVSALALALLVLGAVFVAVAGPRYSLHSRTQALQHELAPIAPVDRAVEVSEDWLTFANQVSFSTPPALDDSQLSESRSQIGHFLEAAPLPLGPGQWAGLSTNPLTVTFGVGPNAITSEGVPPDLEVIYRDALTSNVTVVSGSFPRPSSLGSTLHIAVTVATAARFGLRPGSVVKLDVNRVNVPLIVTAIVRPRGPTSAFWNVDAAALAPSFNIPGATSGVPPYWSGAAFADPGEFGTMQSVFGGLPLELQWDFPLTLGGLQADQVPDLQHALIHAAGSAVTLNGDLAGATVPLSVHAELLTQLTAFSLTDAAVQQVLSLLFVSLTVVGAAVLLLAARINEVRRAVELEMLRSRGASMGQLAALMLRGTGIACVPAALAGAALALLVTPGPAVGLAWWLGGLTALAALLGLPGIAAWRYRKPAPARNPALRPRRAWRLRRRTVAELTACAAAVGGLVVLHDQGTPPPGSVNLYVAAAPALVAIPAVIVVSRLYPLVIRGLLRLYAGGAGASGFLALTRAARTSLLTVAPAFALVLALTVASFAGMVRDAVARGEIAASWQLTGGDAVLDATRVSPIVTPAVQRAAAAVPGVQRTAVAWLMSWQVPDSQILTVVAVDPASYATYTASVPFPAAPLDRLGSSGGVTTVVASPAAAALIGSGVVELTSQSGMGPLRVRVAGTVATTPAAIGAGLFLIMPLGRIAGETGPPTTNLLLMTGTGINQSALTALASKDVPGASVRFRSALLDGLVTSPLQAAADTVMRLSLAVAAGFGLAIMLLGLALGSADRDLTLARLTTMGLQQRRQIWLVLGEALLTVLAAIAAGAACAVTLPMLTSPALNLSVFTGSTAPVPIAPDLVALGVPAGGLAVLAAVAVVAETRLLRRRGVPGLLRIGG